MTVVHPTWYGRDGQALYLTLEPIAVQIRQCAWIGSYTCPRKPPSATAGNEIHQDPEANQRRQSEAARGRTVRVGSLSSNQALSLNQKLNGRISNLPPSKRYMPMLVSPVTNIGTGSRWRDFGWWKRRGAAQFTPSALTEMRIGAPSPKRLSVRLSQTLPDGETAGLGERLNRWKEHFNELLNHPTPATEVAVEPTDEYDCNTAPPTVDEVRDIMRHLRNNKAPDLSSDWSEAILLPFFKKGDRRLCSNYRGISLIDVVAKVFAVLLLRRFQGIRDLRTRPSRGGFRPGRGYVDQIFSLRRTLEQRWAYQQPTVLCFVDFATAFDSVDRGSLLRIMEADGMPAKRLIKGYYQSTRARVRAYGEESETFEARTGVRQGCALSPTLFNYTIDCILGKALRDYAGVAVVRRRKLILYRELHIPHFPSNGVGMSKFVLTSILDSGAVQSHRYFDMNAELLCGTPEVQ
ncbi:unnamed protein product [Acanthosepion pharaonis]|uniref:Reverse transcriptase domain-containing protein n=1 Tax=Acanthosepion pharaonis TaxID=158019 RepID=A0A812CHH9_ACAPH|nr:unnamed protein product [Sepia pharaonis]